MNALHKTCGNFTILKYLRFQLSPASESYLQQQLLNEWVQEWLYKLLVPRKSGFQKTVNFLIHSRKIENEHKLLNRIDIQFLYSCFLNSSLFIYKHILNYMNTFHSQSQDFVIALESFNIFASEEQLNVNFLHWPVS